MKPLCSILLALQILSVPLAAHAFQTALNTWNGSGPFTSELGNQVITAMAVSDDGQTVYAGSGSGTVFSYDYGYLLNIGINGSGKGLVTSDFGGIVCSNNGDTACSATYRHGTVVNLTAATLTAKSTFDNWTDYCSGVGACYTVMTEDRSVSASFGLGSGGVGPKARVQNTGTGYLSIIDAYRAAGSDQVVMAVLGTHPSPAGTLDVLKSVTLKGGYATDQDSNFTTQSGYSDITGPLVIGAGKLIGERVRVK